MSRYVASVGGGVQSPSARFELIVADVYGLAGDPFQAAAHLRQAFELDRACAAMVKTSVAFTSVRNDPGIQHLLAEYGAR